MVPSDWGEAEDMPQDDQIEHEAAIAAAERFLDGPVVPVRRSTLLALLGALRGGVRLLERVLAEADEPGG